MRAGRIENLYPRKAQDHDFHVRHSGELGQEPLRGPEEQRAVQSVDDDVLVEKPSLFHIGDRLVEAERGSISAPLFRATWRRANNTATATPISTATMRSNAIVAVAVSSNTRASERVERSTARTLWISTIRIAVAINTPASAGDGDLRDETTSEEHNEHEHDARVSPRRHACARSRTHVDCGACNRAGCRHPSEQRRDDVGETLTEQFAVGVVTGAVAHAVGNSRRQQALDRREQRNGNPRRQQILDLRE